MQLVALLRGGPDDGSTVYVNPEQRYVELCMDYKCKLVRSDRYVKDSQIGKSNMWVFVHDPSETIWGVDVYAPTS